MRVKLIRKEAREPDDVTAYGAAWLDRQIVPGLVIFGSTKGTLRSIALPRQVPDGSLIWTQRSRPGVWRGGPILSVWAYPHMLNSFSRELALGTEALFLEWVPNELDELLKRYEVEELAMP